MKKKLVSVLLCTAMVASLAVGCGSDTQEETAGENTEGADAAEEESDVQADPVDTKKVYVTPDWVQSVIDGNQEESSDYVILECSWGEEEDSPSYTKGHVPGAYHMNTDSVESEEMWNIRSAEEIEQLLLDYGITKDTTVICYGEDGVNSADDRVAIAFLWAGVENVKCLDGGLAAWNDAGYATESESNEPEAVEEFGITVPAHPEYIISIDDVQDKLENDDNFKLVSIRSEAEWLGETSGYSS